MCKSMGRFIAWPLLICLVISLVGAEVLHYRLCHHHPAGPVQAGGCTWHAHANGVLHAHGPHDSAPDPVPTDPSPEYCLVCQVLSHDAPGVILFSTMCRGDLVADLIVEELCQQPGKPRRCALSRGPPQISIAL